MSNGVTFGPPTAPGFGVTQSPDRDGGRTTTIPQVCWEHEAGRYVTIEMVIEHELDKFSGSISQKIAYNGTVGKYSNKSCMDQFYVDIIKAGKTEEDGKCYGTFNSKNHAIGAESHTLPTLLPIARYFSKWKVLTNPVKYCKREARRGGWPGGSTTVTGPYQGGPAGVGPGGLVCDAEYIVETWRWTPALIDMGKARWRWSMTFQFKTVCRQNECWQCQRPHEARNTIGPPPPPCTNEDISETFEGVMEREQGPNEWRNSPSYIQLDEYTDETGPNLPTYTGFGTLIFSGQMRDQLNQANAALGEDINICADLPSWEDSIDMMEDAWKTKVGA